MCEDMKCSFVIIHDNNFEENKVVERANRSLWECYNRTHATDKRSPVADIFVQGHLRKEHHNLRNISSFFVLRYDNNRLLSNLEAVPVPDSLNLIYYRDERRAQNRVRAVLGARNQGLSNLTMRTGACFWCDSQGWIGSATIT